MKLFIDSKNIVIDASTFVDKLSPFINYGDILYIEIDIMKFGKLYNSKITKGELLQTFYEIFRDLVGYKGHICFPSFSYSWGFENTEKIFDKINTQGKVGVFPEFLRSKKETFRTKDPMFSVIINGPNAEDIAKIQKSSFGENSFFHKIHQLNGKLITFGLNQYDPTFVHYIEEFYDKNFNKIKYRNLKKFEGFYIENGIKSRDEHYVFARNLDSKLRFNDKDLFNDLQNTKKISTIRVGDGTINISDSNSVFDTSISGMKKNINYLVS